MRSIRQQLLHRFPSSVATNEPDGDLALAVYSLLWSMPGLTVDGWLLFRIVHESNESLEAVGLMTLLPSGSVPMSIVVKGDEEGIVWSAQAGQQDRHWLGLSDSKRWNSVYLYASGNREEPGWNWGSTQQGLVQSRDD